MEERKLRTYDKEFKRNAVRLHIEEGRSIRQLCEELGVPHATLFHWIGVYKNIARSTQFESHTWR